MSDAPKWPGTDGSPGLDFSPKPVADSVPDQGNEQGDATRQYSAVSDSAGVVTQPRAEDSSAALSQPTPTPPSAPRPKPRSQRAEDWELDSITRVSSRPSSAQNTSPASGNTALATQPHPMLTESTTRPLSGGSGFDGDEEDKAKQRKVTRRTRKARLRIGRIDPWSVMKISFLFSIAFGIMTIAGVAVLWSLIDSSDTLNQVNGMVNSVIGDPQGGTVFDIREYLSWRRVIGLTMVLSVVDVLIFTAVSTLFAFLYNLAAVVMGGFEITLAED